MRKAAYLYAFLALAGAAGCKMFAPSAPVRHIAESPQVVVTDSGAVKVSGDAKTQPKVDTKKTESKITLPEGSRIEFNEKLGTLSVVLSKASEMASNRTETAIAGPVAFTPDKGATVQDEAAAKSDFWAALGLKAGLVLGIAVGLFGLVRGWDFVMYGGGAVAAACAFGIFVDKHPILLLVIGLGAAIAVIGPIIWHTKLKALSPDAPAPSPKPTDGNERPQ